MTKKEKVLKGAGIAVTILGWLLAGLQYILSNPDILSIIGIN